MLFSPISVMRKSRMGAPARFRNPAAASAEMHVPRLLIPLEQVRARRAAEKNQKNPEIAQYALPQ